MTASSEHNGNDSAANRTWDRLDQGVDSTAVTVLQTLRVRATGLPKQRLQVVHLEWLVQHVVDAQVERAFHHVWRAEGGHQDDGAVGREPSNGGQEGQIIGIG